MNLSLRLLRTLVVLLAVPLLLASCDSNEEDEGLDSFLDCDSVSTIRLGQEIDGELDDDDCESDESGEEGRGYYTDFYFFSLDDDTEVVIDLASDDFDTFLFIYEADEDAPFFGDDDSGGDLNSRLTLDLDEGAYVLGVTTIDEEATGDYELRLEED